MEDKMKIDKNDYTVRISKVDRSLALAYMKVHGEVPEDVTALLDKYEPLLFGIMTPRCFHRIYYTDILLEGDDIKRHLFSCNEIIILAATLGLRTDELIRQTGASDMAGAVVLDAMASAVVEQICDITEAELKPKYKRMTKRYSPGYGDFPLTAQEGLLIALDARRRIGLHATKEGILIPRKSLTAVIGGIKFDF
jgi:hypothetical protein